MSDVIIGRKAEQEILRQRIDSKSPELIAIYDRRIQIIYPNYTEVASPI